MIVDHISNWARYRFGAGWETAFAFLESLSAEAEEKEYPLDGDALFARVMSYPTRRETDSDAILESHRKYADIQMVLRASERIAVYPAHSLVVKTDYDAGRDVIFYHYREPARLQLSLHPGTFACLLPQDAHMPQLATDAPEQAVKKVVVKIALDRLEL